MDIPQDGTLPVQPFISGEHIYLCHLGSTRKIDAYDANGTLQSSISLSAVMPENVQAYVGRGPNLIGTTYIIPCCDTQTKLCFNILVDVNTQEINSSSIQYTQSDGKDTLSAQINRRKPDGLSRHHCGQLCGRRNAAGRRHQYNGAKQPLHLRADPQG